MLFYLVLETLPLFLPAKVTQVANYSSAVNSQAIYLAIDEQREVVLSLDKEGRLIFFNSSNGTIIRQLQIGNGSSPVLHVAEDRRNQLLALLFADGSFTVLQVNYQISFDDNERRSIEPSLETIVNINPTLTLATDITEMVIGQNEQSITIATINPEGKLTLLGATLEEHFLTGELVVETTIDTIQTNFNSTLTKLRWGPDVRYLFIADDNNQLAVLDVHASINNEGIGVIVAQSSLPDRYRITQIEALTGRWSLLVGTDQNTIIQYLFVQTDGAFALHAPRQFDLQAPLSKILPEQRSKGFMVLDQAGNIYLFNSTAERKVFSQRLFQSPPEVLALAPRANAFVALDQNEISFWEVDNPHPEISWHALWSKVWYESYNEPSYFWQSSSADDDFEPKFSFVPLVIGTIKAALYSMLIAVPIAIAGAIFTANFMHPRLRNQIKPTIELLAALPTVVLGFLAGLWLAPYVERHLIAIFLMPLLMIIGVLLMSFMWYRMPSSIRHWIGDGWEVLLVIPMLILGGWLALQLNTPVESLFFGGDVTTWLRDTLGLGFDQRNAIIIGLVIGFAVVPIIFSIAEDAIYSVPKNLKDGSLAMGATHWQTLIKIVLPTASSGIFSAIMIGLGRAVGETMIVLMATGNTPITNMNIFEGMRTLAANIAVEIAETEADSTHFRLLFLSALVLFGFTLFINSTAEVMRERLIRRYGKL